MICGDKRLCDDAYKEKIMLTQRENVNKLHMFLDLGA